MTNSGVSLAWTLPVGNQIEIFVNPQNSLTIPEATVHTMVQNAIDQWNGKSKIILHKNSSAGKDQADLNELYFSNDATVFNGTAVLGVTLVNHNNDNGQILEADILINENYPFSSDVLAENYLGNVIAHEMGHFIGLGHGQVIGATMFYSVARGQSEISEDDKAGIYSIYPTSTTSLGSINGRIIGGKNLTSVFGAQVQAISVKTGKIMGAAISQTNGYFKIDGLARDDQYIIYTNPLEQIGLPSNYSSAQKDFCEASSNYRGSFFQSCGSSNEGFPQAVSLSSLTSSVNVGNITIRCGLDSPPSYLQKKHTNPSEFNLVSFSSNGIGGSFVGFFSNAEIINPSTKDYFKVDLKSVDWTKVSSSNSLYLELKVLNQNFYSPFKANLSVNYAAVNQTITPKYSVSTDGWINIDTISRFPINRLSSSDNDFNFTISPEWMEHPYFPKGMSPPYSKSDLFPDYMDFQDNFYFYLVIATIVKDNGDGTFTQVSSRIDTLSDNTLCPDAANTYALSNYSATGSSSSSNDRPRVISCATVDMNNGSGGGPGGFFIGLVLSVIIAYLSSRYSKMA